MKAESCEYRLPIKRLWLVLLTCTLTLGVSAQTTSLPPASASAPSVPEVKSPQERVEANVRAYEDGFDKADAKAIAAFYAEDAVYRDITGTVIAGRENIEKAHAADFAVNAGATLHIDVESVRSVTPGLVIERGTSIVTTKDGASDSAEYLAISQEKDGKWLITELVELPAKPAPGALAMADLNWLVGEWKDEAAGQSELKTSVRWAENRSFLIRDFTVMSGDEVLRKGHEIIGFDPATNRVRSWTFDSDGGFGEGMWIRQGERWNVFVNNTLPDGRIATAQHIMTRTDNDHLTWESTSRTLDGELQPNIAKIRVVRATAAQP